MRAKIISTNAVAFDSLKASGNIRAVRLEDDSSVISDTLARREIWLLLALLLGSAIFYFGIIPAGIADPEGFGVDQGLPPSFTARVTTILVGLILSVRLIQLLVNPAAASISDADHAEASPDTGALSSESGSSLRNIAGIACALIFAFTLVPTIGYYLASIVMIAVLMWVMGERRWLYITSQPVAVIGLIWVLFDQVFSIKLPTGWLADHWMTQWI